MKAYGPLAALAILLSLVPSVTAAAKPNIVLFVTDDESPIAGCYGSPVIQTPHLDRLASEGTRFTHAYATTASCSASRSVILTGLHNHANGQYGHTHDYHKFETFTGCAALSLPLQLKSLGYRTAHIGKLHVAPESVYQFDRYLKAGGHNTPKWVEACKPLFRKNPPSPSSCVSGPSIRTAETATNPAPRILGPTASAILPRAKVTPAPKRSPTIRRRFRFPRSSPTRPRPAPSSPNTIRASPAPTRRSALSLPRSRMPGNTTTRSSSSPPITAWPFPARKPPSMKPDFTFRSSSACQAPPAESQTTP
jgi:hypothetical protein